MALTGNTVQSTYLDLVQLEKSGAGLPSHAGKEAALYDGSGAQILGRTAVRHWLDPHPDAAAFAETWEFSTKGTMTQGQLETAGWTFSGCTASVSGGILWLTSAADWAYSTASLVVSLSGDFDIVIFPTTTADYELSNADNTYYIGGGGVADTVGDACHHAYTQTVNGYGRVNTIKTGTYSTLSGTAATANVYAAFCTRISRVSGTIYLCGGQGFPSSRIIPDDITPANDGWTSPASVDDSTTFNRVFLSTAGGASKAAKCGFYFLRRFQ